VSQHYHIQVNSDIYTLTKLQEWFEQFQVILPKNTWMQCNLVLVEVFTNVVSYAHEEMPEETPIDIEVIIQDPEGILELKIWDYGKPFDFKTEIDRRMTEAQRNKNLENIDEIPTGGRGLVIAKTIADDLSYESEADGRNCFIMTKKYSIPSAI
jgi:serine/threonine-protein kinase RsbW